jgi:hypothetical protein
MKSLLHHYGILTTEMVTVIRHVSETSWRIFSIHWRMKQRQSATRRLWVGATHFHGVFRALKNRVSTTAVKSTRNTIVTWAHCIAVIAHKSTAWLNLERRYVPFREICLIFTGIGVYKKMFVKRRQYGVLVPITSET